MKDVQCYELFGGIALKKSHIFIFFFIYIGQRQEHLKQIKTVDTLNVDTFTTKIVDKILSMYITLVVL